MHVIGNGVDHELLQWNPLHVNNGRVEIQVYLSSSIEVDHEFNVYLDDAYQFSNPVIQIPLLLSLIDEKCEHVS